MSDTVDSVNALVTLDEVRRRLNIAANDTERDGVLVALINTTARWLNSITDRKLKERAYTNELIDGCGGTELFLPNWPVDRTQTFTVNADATRTFASSTLLTLWNESATPVTDDIILHDDEGILEHLTSSWPRGRKTVKISYTAGIPTDEDSAVIEANLELLDAMWCNMGEQLVASWSGGGISTSLITDIGTRIMPPRVRSILNGERRVTL